MYRIFFILSLIANSFLYATPEDDSGFVEKKDLPTYRERDVQIRSESDELIQRMIQDYIDGRLNDPRDNVYVSVDDGVVTLTGTVANANAEIDLVEMVRHIKGVTDIIDELEIWRPIDQNTPPENPKGPFEIEYNMSQNPPDDRVWNSSNPIDEMGLKGQIRNEIQEYEDVTFGVFNSDVILEGYVETGRDRKEIERRLRALKGVNKIDNRIQVRNKYPAHPRYH